MQVTFHALVTLSSRKVVVDGAVENAGVGAANAEA
jgi:hypothetical protein